MTVYTLCNAILWPYCDINGMYTVGCFWYLLFFHIQIALLWFFYPYTCTCTCIADRLIFDFVCFVYLMSDLLPWGGLHFCGPGFVKAIKLFIVYYCITYLRLISHTLPHTCYVTSFANGTTKPIQGRTPQTYFLSSTKPGH